MKKRNWTRYLPELRIVIELQPFFSLRTEALCQQYDSMTRSFLRFYVSVWKWKFSFDSYYRDERYY